MPFFAPWSLDPAGSLVSFYFILRVGMKVPSCLFKLKTGRIKSRGNSVFLGCGLKVLSSVTCVAWPFYSVIVLIDVLDFSCAVAGFERI